MLKMNQILTFCTTEDSQKRIKNATIFFCVLIIIFGLIFIAEGVFGIYTQKNQKLDVVTPYIKLERAGEVSRLNISSEAGIKKVKYYWKILSEDNTGKTTEQNFNGDKKISLDISTLNGTNELYIEVLDGNNNYTKYEPMMISYQMDNNGDVVDWDTAISNDKTNPKISLEAESGKIKIKAVDNLKMSYIAYHWNDGAETTITGLSEDEKTVQESVDVPEGSSTLYVRAVDRAGNEEKYEKKIQGVKGPNLTVGKDGNQIVINVTDDEKITKIEYNFNNQVETIDNINSKTFEKRLDLVDGDNFIIVEAYRDDVKSTFKGKTTK